MYYLTEFNGVDLPLYNPFTQAGSRPLIAPIARMADGRAFDRLGEVQAEQGSGNISYVGNFYDNQGHKNEESYYAMLGEVGKSGWLVRKREPTGTYERIYARLMGVDYTHTTQWAGKVVENVRLTFFMVDPTWNGLRYGNYEPAFGAMKRVDNTDFVGLPGMPINSAVSVTGAAATSSVQATLTNTGNAPVKAFRILIQPVSNSHTGGIQIQYAGTADIGGQFEIQYTPTITVAAGCVIDTLAKSVTDTSGNGLISGFAYGSNHASGNWLMIPALVHNPTMAVITITSITGNFPTGGVDFDFEFCEAWQ